MIEIRVGSEEKRKEILSKKKNLKGRRERITEDWTWKEKKMRWKLEEIAREEKRKRRNVGKLWKIEN